MIDYWIEKHGLEEAAERYYEGPKDETFKVLLAQYKAAEFALTAYMTNMEHAATNGDTLEALSQEIAKDLEEEY